MAMTQLIHCGCRDALPNIPDAEGQAMMEFEDAREPA